LAENLIFIQEAGGGRTYSAKATSSCLAAISCGRKGTTRRNTGLGVGEALVGDADCAATQTWHVLDSSWLECWCNANAIADQIVSNSESHAIRLMIDCMEAWSPMLESTTKIRPAQQK